MIGVIVLGIVFGTLLHCELTNPNSRIRCRLWCRKHGLKLKERPGPECATFWSGEDELGNEYGPGEDGEPVKIKEGGAKNELAEAIKCGLEVRQEGGEECDTRE